MAIVTDHEWMNKDGTPRIGYYMDRWLKNNLDGIPFFISKKYDVVGIISGTSKVRLGKSTLALQVAYYIAWILAGGRTILNETGTTVQIIPPKNKVRFGLDHIVFAPEDLKKKAHQLPPNSVIVYDEGRAGLDSSRSMESVNKGMQDFFQECGVFGHVILIVLPDFFQLHQTYAVSRSLFLLNVFTDDKFNRGYFSFYNETQKELLYFWGKKKVGASFRYMSAKRNFWGRFSDWLPVDKDAYEKMKKEALAAKSIGHKQLREMKARDLLIHYIIMKLGVTRKDLVSDLDKFGYNSDTENLKFSEFVVDRALRNIERVWAGGEFVPDNVDERLEIKRELDAWVVMKLKQREEYRARGEKWPPVPILDKDYWLRKLEIIKSEDEQVAKMLEMKAETGQEDELSSETKEMIKEKVPEVQEDKKLVQDVQEIKEVPQEFIGEGVMPEEINQVQEETEAEPPPLGENFVLPDN